MPNALSIVNMPAIKKADYEKLMEENKMLKAELFNARQRFAIKESETEDYRFV